MMTALHAPDILPQVGSTETQPQVRQAAPRRNQMVIAKAFRD